MTDGEQLHGDMVPYFAPGWNGEYNTFESDLASWPVPAPDLELAPTRYLYCQAHWSSCVMTTRATPGAGCSRKLFPLPPSLLPETGSAARPAPR
jgi:hypothetical protein